ncbi:universal stress protein [Streptomyces sp. CAI-21]|uniref:universal stress protein n=1 Tax=Streptomyces TaxID=1883 RepID=UPI0001CE7E05|nr:MULTISPECIES: universal stress protein [Streptomyces]MBO1282887.1 universal stress protein [Streptomyces sampsonii]MYX85106.1 universal stress protein [Streptomyces sp. SID4915]NUW07025.1 universal stress protein [Streptomyces sp. CAI-21]EFE85151.1 turgor pressure sensor [Streptomyces albidoflavus]RZE30157.1 pressure sensor protein [Streptomyces albidoflavus]
MPPPGRAEARGTGGPVRGTLRVYLGAAPGVGKTYAMLAEGQRLSERGTDVVIAFVEDYGRPRTRQMAEGLESVPRRTLEHRGRLFSEMDLDAVLARRPQVALVDELAHSNVADCRNTKRWQDIEELLQAGIDVISTVNVQHLQSLNDVVQYITGVRQHETVPDEVVRAADQIELVDLSAEALRRRLAEGDVYPAEKAEVALRHYFRPGNLTALREIAMLWAADRVDEALLRYRHAHSIQEPWATRDRLLVALSGGPEGETLIRRAKRAASHASGGEFLAVHVSPDDSLARRPPPLLDRQRALVEELGGTLHTVRSGDTAQAVLALARQVNATQILIGASRSTRLRRLFSRNTVEALIEGSGDHIDVLVVTHAKAAHNRLFRRHVGGRGAGATPQS